MALIVADNGSLTLFCSLEEVVVILKLKFSIIFFIFSNKKISIENASKFLRVLLLTSRI